MIYKGKAIVCERTKNDVVELTFDLQESSVNKFNQVTIDELKEAIELLKKESGVKGLLIQSAKPAFIVGADINEFLTGFNRPAEEFEQWLMGVNQTFSSIEDLPYPSVVAINGMALGGGFELALSASFRIADDRAKVGLPETKLGIFPGWGGTVRLSRLTGADNAIEWIASGKQNTAKEGLKIGALDAIVSADQLKEASMELLNRAISGELDWESRQKEKKSPLHLNKIESMMCFEGAKGFVGGMAGPNYPAPVKAIEVMQQGATLTRDEALPIEAKGFVEMAKTPVAHSLVSIFLADQYVKKKSRTLAKTTEPVKKSAVLGAGIMGGGVAYQSASRGIPIVMKDINDQAIELGMNEATTLLTKQVKRGKIDIVKMAKVLTQIKPTLSYAELESVDLVVEAVVENEKIKKSVLKELEGQVRKDTILTSNTSTISINSLAEGLERPENFCGMHFFNPVHRMPLVEVIRGKKSSDEAIARTVSYATAMGKTPIVVNDCPGFLVNRVLFPYFNGFLRLLNEGADFKAVDKVMEKFGWPMGPAYLLDVVGMDTAHHASEVMAKAFPDRMSLDHSAMNLLFQAKRFGQKNKKGFYLYELDRKGKLKKTTDPEVQEILKGLSPKGSKEFSAEDIVARLMLPMLIESARCLEEGIVDTATEVDLGLIYGLGFPPFRGGIFRWADSLGMKEVCAMADQFQSIGKLYEPTAGMLEMAKSNTKYHTV